jgi:hypothetical protein
VIALLGALAIVPAQAHAATLTPDHACYLEGATASLTGTAFTPGSNVGLTLDGRPFGTALADTRGTFTTLGGVPELTRGNSTRVKLTATDRVNPAITATTSFRVTSLGVAVDTSHGRKPDRRATFRARGFHVSSTLWLHYLTPGLRLYKTIKIGKLAHPCGTASRRTSLIPSHNARPGRWRLRFDTHKRYSRKTRPQVRLAVMVKPKKG